MPKVVLQQQFFLEVFKTSPEQSGLTGLALDFRLCRSQDLRPVMNLTEVEILFIITYFDTRSMCITWELEQTQCLLARLEKSF